MAAIGRPVGIFGTPWTDTARACLACAIVTISFTATQAAGLELPAGASSCTGCHPTKAGIDTSVPTLVGRNAGDIVAAMEAFGNGQKPATVMDRIAKGFTVEEVQAIATWYAAQR